MSTVTTNYTTAAVIFATTDLDSLASSTTLVAGRESNVIDNTTNKFVDALLSGRFKTNNTAPTAGGAIQVWVGELLDDTQYPDVFDGTGSAETSTSADIRNANLKLAISIPNDATANRIYEFSGISVAQLFGGVLPPKWFVFVTQSTGQALNATANNGGQCWYKGIKYDVI
jgi:hypothetical protein